MAVSDAVTKNQTDALMRRGCQVISFPVRHGGIDVTKVLEWLGTMDATNVLVEGGGEVLGSFFDAGQVDEVMAFVGPQIVGGSGTSPVLGAGIAQLSEAHRLGRVTQEMLGDTILIRGRLGTKE